MASKPAPAIRAELDERYAAMERIETIGSETRFERGRSELGTKVELVDMSFNGGCPRCGESEMIVSTDLGPDYIDAFYCTNVGCPHSVVSVRLPQTSDLRSSDFVQDAVEYDMDLIRANQPETWDNTARCPSCDTRHTVQLHRDTCHHRTYIDGNADDGGIVQAVCDDCEPGDDGGEA